MTMTRVPLSDGGLDFAVCPGLAPADSARRALRAGVGRRVRPTLLPSGTRCGPARHPASAPPAPSCLSRSRVVGGAEQQRGAAVAGFGAALQKQPRRLDVAGGEQFLPAFDEPRDLPRVQVAHDVGRRRWGSRRRGRASRPRAGGGTAGLRPAADGSGTGQPAAAVPAAVRPAAAARGGAWRRPGQARRGTGGERRAVAVAQFRRHLHLTDEAIGRNDRDAPEISAAGTRRSLAPRLPDVSRAPAGSPLMAPKAAGGGAHVNPERQRIVDERAAPLGGQGRGALVAAVAAPEAPTI